MKNKKLIIILFLVIFILIVILGSVFYVRQQNKANISNSKNTNDVKETELNVNNSDNIEDKTNVKPNKLNNDLIMVEAFLNYIEKCASTGYILKANDGDVLAPKLTVDEARNNRKVYKEKLTNISNNKSVVISNYEKDSKTYYIFSPHKLLAILDLSSHMGTGLGLVDGNGNKLYTLNEEINLNENEPYGNESIIKGFGYNSELLITNILDNIEKYALNNYILNGTSKLTVDEAKSNRQKYKDILANELDNTDIFIGVVLEGNTLKCEYNIENALTKLNLKSNNIENLDVNENGCKIFSW
ncbi:MAG: hypothetical protein RSC92_01480 [Clostridia bacterium]